MYVYIYIYTRYSIINSGIVYIYIYTLIYIHIHTDRWTSPSGAGGAKDVRQWTVHAAGRVISDGFSYMVGIWLVYGLNICNVIYDIWFIGFMFTCFLIIYDIVS